MRYSKILHIWTQKFFSYLNYIYSYIILLAWVVRRLPILRVKRREISNKKIEERKKMAPLLVLVIFQIVNELKMILKVPGLVPLA